MDGVTDVTVDLEGGKADVKATHDIPEADFRKVIEDAGYERVGGVSFTGLKRGSARRCSFLLYAIIGCVC